MTYNDGTWDIIYSRSGSGNIQFVEVYKVHDHSQRNKANDLTMEEIILLKTEIEKLETLQEEELRAEADDEIFYEIQKDE